jgi:hypothetical protein
VVKYRYRPSGVSLSAAPSRAGSGPARAAGDRAGRDQRGRAVVDVGAGGGADGAVSGATGRADPSPGVVRAPLLLT